MAKLKEFEVHMREDRDMTYFIKARTEKEAVKKAWAWDFNDSVEDCTNDRELIDAEEVE